MHRGRLIAQAPADVLGSYAAGVPGTCRYVGTARAPEPEISLPAVAASAGFSGRCVRLREAVFPELRTMRTDPPQRDIPPQPTGPAPTSHSGAIRWKASLNGFRRRGHLPSSLLILMTRHWALGDSSTPAPSLAMRSPIVMVTDGRSCATGGSTLSRSAHWRAAFCIDADRA